MSPRRVAVLLALLTFAAGAVASAAPGRTRVQKRVLVDGDSIAYGTDLFLARYLRGWQISSSVDVSRHAYQGAASIEALGRLLPPVVVVNLGTNDDPRAVSTFASYVRRVVRAAGPERCVIWATIVRPPYAGVSYDGPRKQAYTASGFDQYDNPQDPPPIDPTLDPPPPPPPIVVRRNPPN